MICKYCKNKNHAIDNCPDIICRICKQYGHPHWKCKKNLTNKSHGPTIQVSNNTSNNISKKKHRPSKFNTFESTENVNIEYFKQYLDVSWGEI